MSVEGEVVGEYFADILVDDRIVRETKAVKYLTVEHEAQLLNDLKTTGVEVGLLLTLGVQPEFRRKAIDNTRRKNLRVSA
jgi:GxxExxY protein